ncbi:hypothetical protein BGZ73_008277 [Actinomortierella ambigua]|nr:hypothetical protein BGZ73_008277 [Actinomortierella ambigua]
MRKKQDKDTASIFSSSTDGPIEHTLADQDRDGSFNYYEDKIRAAFSSASEVAFTLDGWTSPFKNSFLAVTAHFTHHYWSMQDLALGFGLV